MELRQIASKKLKYNQGISIFFFSIPILLGLRYGPGNKGLAVVVYTYLEGFNFHVLKMKKKHETRDQSQKKFSRSIIEMALLRN